MVQSDVCFRSEQCFDKSTAAGTAAGHSAATVSDKQSNVSDHKADGAESEWSDLEDMREADEIPPAEEASSPAEEASSSAEEASSPADDSSFGYARSVQSPEEKSRLLAAGRTLVKQKKYAEALDVMETIKEPSLQCLMQICVSYHELIAKENEAEDKSDLIEYATRIIEDPMVKDEQEILALYWRGRAYAAGVSDEMAHEDLSRALELDGGKNMLFSIELRKVKGRLDQKSHEQKRKFYKEGEAKRTEERRKCNFVRSFKPHALKH